MCCFAGPVSIMNHMHCARTQLTSADIKAHVLCYAILSDPHLEVLSKDEGNLVIQKPHIPREPVQNPPQRVGLEEPHGRPQHSREHSVVELPGCTLCDIEEQRESVTGEKRGESVLVTTAMVI